MCDTILATKEYSAAQPQPKPSQKELLRPEAQAAVIKLMADLFSLCFSALLHVLCAKKSLRMRVKEKNDSAKST
jgi:hypothetical protein